MAAAQWAPVTGLPAGFNAADVAIAQDGAVFTCGTATNAAQSGFYRSTNGGSSWTRQNSGMVDQGNNEVAPWRIGAYPEITLAATNGAFGIYRSANAGGSWTGGGLGVGSAFWDFCRFNADTYFATKRENVVGNSGVWRSLDRGATWERTSTGLYGLTIPVVGEIIATEAVTAHHGKMFAAVATSGVFRSTNAGDSWIPVNNNVFVEGTVVGPVTSATDVVSTGDRLFASIQNRSSIYMSEDDGDSWREVTTGLGQFSHRMAVDGGKLYAPTFDGKLYVTTDGRSWQYYPNTGLPGGGQPFPAVKQNVAAYYTTSAGLYKYDLSGTAALNIAPVVIAQPTGAARTVGQSHTFTVAVNGTGPFTYQWLKGGTLVGNPSSSPALTLDPLTLDDSGSYSCRITGPGGTSDSEARLLTVAAEVPGTVDPSFDTGVPNPSNSAHIVYAVSVRSDGRLWAGGTFTRRFTDGTSTNTAAGALLTWSGEPLRFGTDPGVGIGVRTLLPLASGKMLAGGSFTGIAVAGNIKYLARFNADGTWDTTTTFGPNGTGAGEVRTLAEDTATGKIYVAGNFQDWGGDTARDSIVRLNADGTVDSAFSSASFPPSTTINSLTVASDGKVYVGGTFDRVVIGGNANFSIRYLVRLKPDGTVDETFAVPVNQVLSGVNAMLLLPDGRFIVAASGNGHNKVLQRFLPSGAADTTFDTGTGPNVNGINTLLLQPDGRLLVGGVFTSFNGVNVPARIARLHPDGSVDASVTWQAPTPMGNNAAPASLALRGNRLYAGYINAGNTNRAVRRFFTDVKEPAFTVPFAPLSVNAGSPATLKAYVYSTQAVTYQWFKDGVLLNGQTSDTLTFPNAAVTNTGTYTLRVTHPAGTVTSNDLVFRVLAAPQLGTPVTSVVHPGNRDLDLAPDVFGQAPLTYQWLKNGTPITPNAATGGGGTITGFNTPSLKITGLHENDNAVYTLRVTNSQGTIDVPISVTALSQPGYLPLDFTGPGGNIQPIIGSAGNNRFFALGSGGLSTWNGTAVTSPLLRINPDNTLDNSFTGPPFAGGSLAGVKVLSSGQILVWGGFTSVAGQNRPTMARLNADGTLDATFTANNGTAVVTGGIFIDDVVELRDGKLLVCGNFENWGAGPTFTGYRYLVCLDPNGTVNTDFMNQLGGAPSHQVKKLGLTTNGKPVLMGNFVTIGGQSRNWLAVLENSGAVSASFVPPAITGGNPGGVNSILPLPDGRLLVGGTFTTVSGTAGLGGWAVLKPDGSRDATVNTAGAIANFPTHFALDAANGVLIANYSDGAAVNGLRRFHYPALTLDTDFLPVNQNLTGFNAPTELLPLPGGRIVLRFSGQTYQGRPVGGTAILRGYPVALGFITQPMAQAVSLGGSATLMASTIGTSPVTYQWLKDGTPVSGQTSATLTITNAARDDSAVYSLRATNVTGGTVTSSGARLTVLAEPVFTAISSSRTLRAGDSVTISATAIGVQPISYQWLKNGSNIPGATSAILTLPPLSMDAAASYTCAASNIVEGIAALTISPPVHISVAGGNGGTLDPAFPLSFTGFAGAKVECLLPQADGQITIAGSQQLFNNYHYAARYKADGTKTGTFLATSGTGAASCNNSIYSVARDPVTGNYVAVGAFTLLGGANRNRIGRFTPDFLADTTFDPGTGFTETTAFASANGAAVAVDAGSRIYAGGSFTTYNGETVSRLVRLFSTGARDTSFVPPAFNNGVNALLPVGDKLLVAGGFNQVNGVASPPLVRLNSNGTLDATFNSALNGGSVYDLAAGPEGDIIVAGSGTVAGNSYLHRLNADGTRETGFNTGTTINGTVRAVAVQQDGKVFIGGQFGAVNGQARVKVAKLNADGTLDTTWNPGGGATNGTGNVYDIALGTNGTLYVGGDFLTFDGQTRQFIAAVYGTTAARAVVSLPAPPAAVLGQPLTLGVAATGVAFASQPFLTYQWLKNDQEIQGATGQTLTLESYSNADAGRYTVRVTDANGSTTSNPVDLPEVGDGFDSWASVLPVGQHGPGDDPDADGVSNLMEYALDLNPLNSSSSALPQAVMTATHLTYTYRRARTDVIYSVEASDSINVPWSPANVNQGTPAADGTTTASIPLTAAEDFLRLRVTLVP